MLIPPLAGFMALVPQPETTATLEDRIAGLSRMVRQTLVIVGMQGKGLAARMWLRDAHLTRQLNEDGLNCARLANAGREFWLHLIVPFVEFVGLTRDDIVERFGLQTDVDRDAREQKQDDEIAALKQQLADVLRRLPPVTEDVGEERVA